MENSLIHLIPETRLAAVEAALSASFGSATVDQLQLLSGGLSGSAVYKIVVDSRPYVLKMDADSGKGNPALVHASAAGIAPRVYFAEPATGITITEFVQGRPVRGALPPDQLVNALASTVRAIHAIPHPIPGRGLLASIEAIKSEFLQSGVLKGPVIDACFVHYTVLKQRYPWDDPDTVLSHNDLNPGNLLWDGTALRVIDWDTAFSNDRYFDLATVANFFVHTEEQEEAYLRGYFGVDVEDRQKARFYVMRQISRIIYSMLLVQAAAKTQPAGGAPDQDMEGVTLKAFGELIGAGRLSMTTPDGQLMYGKAQMNEAVRQMRTPRFAAALEMLS